MNDLLKLYSKKNMKINESCQCQNNSFRFYASTKNKKKQRRFLQIFFEKYSFCRVSLNQLSSTTGILVDLKKEKKNTIDSYF